MVNIVSASVLLLVLPSTVTCDLMYGSKFLAPRMSTAHIRAQLQGVLGEVLGLGHGVDNLRLNKMRQVLSPMFQALPKNKKGKLSAPVMRYIVRRYFSQQNAWIVKGFEPHADAVANVSHSAIDPAGEENVLQGKVPDYIRVVLENQFQHEGFALEDIVAMVAALERLAFDEVVKTVEKTYYLNSISVSAQINRAQLMEVVSSYLITQMLEGTDDKHQHLSDKANIMERYPNWETTYLFLIDVVSSDIFERRNTLNPFIEAETFTFEDAVRMSEEVSEQFGPWSNHECHEMRNMLAKLDVHNTGRVKITDFYQSTIEGAWQFLEPSRFLRMNGALDESSSYLGPQVIVANYIAGMSNCITSAPYYAICCLNDCDQVYQHIEAVIPHPNASASQILRAVKSVPQGADISPELLTKLSEIAALHDDQVPIHGRLLAQWLHYVFPHECPYPHMSGLSPKTQEQWRAEVGEELESVTEDEVREHFEQEPRKLPPSNDAGKGMWLLKESVLKSSTPSDADASASQVLRLVAQLGMVGAFGVLVIQKARRLSPSPGKPIEYDI